jgi:hypothetical protein
MDVDDFEVHTSTNGSSDLSPCFHFDIVVIDYHVCPTFDY